MCTGERYPEDGVGPEAALVGRAIELDEVRIDSGLICRIFTEQRRCDGIDDVGDGRLHSLAAIAGSIAIPKLDGLVRAPRSAPMGPLHGPRPPHR